MPEKFGIPVFQNFPLPAVSDGRGDVDQSSSDNQYACFKCSGPGSALVLTDYQKVQNQPLEGELEELGIFAHV